MSRLLGVDYGSKRVGLALSDALGITAQPLEVVLRADATDRIVELAADYEVEVVVVGLPTGLSGGEGVSAEEARLLGDELESHDLVVEYVDERFTSRLANKALLESGMRRRDRRDNVDKVAAAIILQGYLDQASRGNSDVG